jgi:hypothetical protein
MEPSAVQSDLRNISERCSELKSKLEQMSQNPFVPYHQLVSVVSDATGQMETLSIRSQKRPVKLPKLKEPTPITSPQQLFLKLEAENLKRKTHYNPSPFTKSNLPTDY